MDWTEIRDTNGLKKALNITFGSGWKSAASEDWQQERQRSLALSHILTSDTEEFIDFIADVMSETMGICERHEYVSRFLQEAIKKTLWEGDFSAELAKKMLASLSKNNLFNTPIILSDRYTCRAGKTLWSWMLNVEFGVREGNFHINNKEYQQYIDSQTNTQKAAYMAFMLGYAEKLQHLDDQTWFVNLIDKYSRFDNAFFHGIALFMPFTSLNDEALAKVMIEFFAKINAKFPKSLWENFDTIMLSSEHRARLLNHHYFIEEFNRLGEYRYSSRHEQWGLSNNFEHSAHYRINSFMLSCAMAHPEEGFFFDYIAKEAQSSSRIYNMIHPRMHEFQAQFDKSKSPNDRILYMFLLAKFMPSEGNGCTDYSKYFPANLTDAASLTDEELSRVFILFAFSVGYVKLLTGRDPGEFELPKWLHQTAPDSPTGRHLLSFLDELYASPSIGSHPDTIVLIKSIETSLFGAVQSLYKRVGNATNVGLRDSGQVIFSGFSVILRAIRCACPVMAAATAIKQKAAPMFKKQSSINAMIAELEVNGTKIDQTSARVYGRTLLINMTTADGTERVLAFKVQKREDLEDEDALNEEHTFKMKHHESGALQSHVPQAVKLFNAEAIEKDVNALVDRSNADIFFGEKKASRSGHVHAYIGDPKYFKSLHNPSETDFETYIDGSERAAIDLANCLRGVVGKDGETLIPSYTVFHQLTAMHHNTSSTTRSDRGRYMSFSALFYNFLNNPSPGRWEGWIEAVRRVNIVASGLKDFGDSMQLSDYRDKHTQFLRAYLSEARADEGVLQAQLTDFLGGYMLSFRLIAMLRGRNEEQLHKISGEQMRVQFWLLLAKQHVKTVSTLIATLLDDPIEDVCRELEESISVERLARQMQFWGTDEYIEHVNKGVIPEDIYGEDVDVGGLREGTYSKEKGCCRNGIDPDLGSVNGQDPIWEAISLRIKAATYLLEKQGEKQAEAGMNMRDELEKDTPFMMQKV